MTSAAVRECGSAEAKLQRRPGGASVRDINPKSKSKIQNPSFLPPDLLSRLGGLDLIARTAVRGFLSGIHRSPVRGSGDEFLRHREYQPGDDLRHLDWRLHARSDRLMVREYREQSNLRACLVVDATASMEYAGPAGAGGVSKLRYGCMLAAALAYLMLDSGDAVALISTGDGVVTHLPPRSRSGQLRELLLRLERLEPAGASSASPALDSAGELLRRPGRVVLISDCLEPDDGEALVAAASRLRARGDEIIVLRVLTPYESGDAPLPAATFSDPEAAVRPRTGAPAADAGYAARVREYYASLNTRLIIHGAEYVACSTAQPVERALGAWLGRRAA